MRVLGFFLLYGDCGVIETRQAVVLKLTGRIRSATHGEHMKRAIKLEGLNKELELAKVTSVKLEHTNKEFIYLEKMKDDYWRLTFTEKTIKDIKELKGLKIIRED
jgi:hypothetical protein